MTILFHKNTSHQRVCICFLILHLHKVQEGGLGDVFMYGSQHKKKETQSSGKSRLLEGTVRMLDYCTGGKTCLFLSGWKSILPGPLSSSALLVQYTDKES